jgi:mono/diheme cytochrome c family protein
MSTAKRFVLTIPLALVAGLALAADGPGLGKPISEADLAKWDISVPPDGKGLPSGSGTPAQGAVMYAQKCEVCHGKDGVGGTNAALANPPGKSDRTHGALCPERHDDFRLHAPCDAVAAAKDARQ